MLVRAIKTNQLHFLYCVWAFNKNYERVLETAADQISDESDYDSSEDEDGNPKPYDKSGKYRTFTFDRLFKLILEYCPDTYLPKIRAVTGFGLFSSENFIMSLLINRQDVIASDHRYIKAFAHDLTKELMVFAIRNQNEYFLRFTLFNQFLGGNILNQKVVRDEILEQLATKSKTEFLLNILIFTDFSRWPQTDLNTFIDHLDEMTGEPHEQNRIVLSYNPILTICLACLHLRDIGNSISLFKHRGQTMSDSLLELGENIVGEMRKEVVEQIFMDQDFKNRTVLHLITYNGLAPLISDGKVTVLLDKLWQGKLTYQCDGRVSDYSKLTYLVTAPVKKLPGQTISFLSIINPNFSPHVDKESYAVQFKFRKSSIAIIFKKNFLSAVLVVVIFTYINMMYQELFNMNQFVNGETEDEIITKMEDNL